MSKTVSQRTDGASADLVFPDEIVEYYADGLAGVQLGFPNSRMQLYVVTDPATPENTVEKRKISATVIVPTSSLIEFVRSIGAAFVVNGPALDQANKQLTERISQMLSGFQPPAEADKKGK